MLSLYRLSSVFRVILVALVLRMGASWVSANDITGYCQGGIAQNGTVYVTGDHGAGWWMGLPEKSQTDYPYVGSFNVTNGAAIQTYDFDDTYDSTPMLVQQTNGTWLIVAHEYMNERTVALNRDTGALVWTSPANQPGVYFFAYATYVRSDGITVILSANRYGLHALSAEDGTELWTISNGGYDDGITPCVDQSAGFVYYQSHGQLHKINGETGAIVKSVAVSVQSQCVTWNTVLVDDAYGKYIATYWIGAASWTVQWASAIRVYDADLNLVWEHKNLPHGKKHVLTYFDGKLTTGPGNDGAGGYTGNAWKRITAYHIADGSEAWTCDLSEYLNANHFISSIPCFNGYLFADTQGYGDNIIFKINASSGALEEVFRREAPASSCAQSFITHGKLFSGERFSDRMLVTEIATNSFAEWSSAFGLPRQHTMTLASETGAGLVAMQALESQTYHATWPQVRVTTTPHTVEDGNGNDFCTVSGTNNAYVTGTMTWVNELTGDSGEFAATANWEVADIPLAGGRNMITVKGSDSPSSDARFTCDSVVIDVNLRSAGPNSTNALPYSESFESYATGSRMPGTNGWSACSLDVGTISTNPAVIADLNAFSANCGFPLKTSHGKYLRVTGVATNTFHMASNQVVWVDSMVQAVRQSLLLSTNLITAAQTACYFNEDGHPTLLHRDLATGTNRWSEVAAVTVESNAWVRLTFALDYRTDDAIHGARYYQVRVNEQLLTHTLAYTTNDGSGSGGGSWFPMARETPPERFSAICIQSDNGDGLDDLVVGTDNPFLRRGTLFSIR